MIITARYEESLADLVAERRTVLRRIGWRWAMVPASLAVLAMAYGGWTDDAAVLVFSIFMWLLAAWLLWAIWRTASPKQMSLLLERHRRRPFPETVVVRLHEQGVESRREGPEGLPDRTLLRVSWNDVRRVRVRKGALEIWTRLVLVRIPAHALDDPSEVMRTVDAWRRAGPEPLEPLPAGVIRGTFTPRVDDTIHYVRERWTRGIVTRTRLWLRLVFAGLFMVLLYSATSTLTTDPSLDALWPVTLMLLFWAPVTLRSFARGWYERLLWPIRTWLQPGLVDPVTVDIDADWVCWSGGIGQHGHAWHAMGDVTWTPHQCWITLAHGADLVVPREAFDDPEAAEAQMAAWLRAGHARNPLPLPEGRRADGTPIEAPDPENPFASPGGD